MRRFAPCLVLISTTFACVTLERASSGEVGCPPEEITISNKTSGWTASTWTAECRGRRYFCTGSETISCSPEVGSASSVPPGGDAAAPTDGCQFDTQCKGDRICTDGACVEPELPPAPVSPTAPEAPETPEPATAPPASN